MAPPPVHVPHLEEKLDLLIRLDPGVRTRRQLARRMGLKSASNFTAWARGTETWRADHVPNGRISGLAAAFDIPTDWLRVAPMEQFEELVSARYAPRRSWRQYVRDGSTPEASGVAPIDQTIRFSAGADGVSIAFATAGEGPPLVKAGNWLSHLEHDWHSPVWRHLFSWLTARHRLVRYDPRGSGLSDWEVDEISFDAFRRDLETVVDAAGLERFALFGTSQGAGLAAAYAARHPERVSRLVLLGGLVSGWAGLAIDREAIAAMEPAIARHWGQDNPAFRQMFTSMFIPGAGLEEMRWFNELQRITVSPRNAVRILRTIGEMDGWSRLPAIGAPTLVLHARGDAVVRFDEGRRIAAAIPNARFVPLESENHLLLAREPAFERLRREVDRFLAEPSAPGASG